MKTMILAMVLIFGTAAQAASQDIQVKTDHCETKASEDQKLDCYNQALAEGKSLMDREFSLRKKDLLEPSAVSTLESSQYVWRQSLGPKCFSSRQEGEVAFARCNLAQVLDRATELSKISLRSASK